MKEITTDEILNEQMKTLSELNTMLKVRLEKKFKFRTLKALQANIALVMNLIEMS